MFKEKALLVKHRERRGGPGGFSSRLPTPSRGGGGAEPPRSSPRAGADASGAEQEALAFPVPGTGEPHRGVFKGRVPVREQASQDAPVLGVLARGEEAELFAEDHTRRWRSLVCFSGRNFSKAHNDVLLCFGWVLVHSDAHGDLLRKGHGKLRDNFGGWVGAVRSEKLRCELIDSALRDDRNRELRLLKAVRSGSVNETTQLLWARANVDSVDSLGETALFEATGARALNMMLVLLLARSDPAHQSVSGTTPLAMAEGPGHRALLAGFAQGGSSLDEKQRMDLDTALAGSASTPLVEATRRRLFGAGKVEDDAADGEVSGEESEAAAQLAVDKDEMMRQLIEENEKLRKRIAEDLQHPHEQRPTELDVNQGPKPEMLDSQQEQQPPPRQDAVEGELFRVVFAGGRMAIREKPMQSAKIIDTRLMKGDEVRLLEADETGNWRKVIVTCNHFHGLPGPGWVLLRSEKLGTLLEKGLDTID